ncbi:MAG: hypothetical protein M3Z25_23965, partial [Actinomycetota bacterium]|nr:hypothetical protein [Actinomycetota bacterium]
VALNVFSHMHQAQLGFDEGHQPAGGGDPQAAVRSGSNPISANTPVTWRGLVDTPVSALGGGHELVGQHSTRPS